jgi:crotonobetainyl-CoA:carnitine CoA-transferase CaiB-like acyl-CoA transferase
MGTAMALYRRERDGSGEIVDVALYEPLMFIVGDMILQWEAMNDIQGRVGNGTGSASPRGIYQAADGGWLSIAASNQGIAKRLFVAMDRADLIDDPQFATNPARLANNDAIQAIVIDWVASMPRDKVLAVLEEHEVVSAAVNDASDIVVDPHFRERTLVELTGNDVLGRVLMPGPVLHLRGYDGPRYDGVPRIGEHSRAILSDWIGLSESELDELQAAGVMGQAQPIE